MLKSKTAVTKGYYLKFEFFADDWHKGMLRHYAPIISRHQILWDSRRKRKKTAAMASLLSHWLGHPIVAKPDYNWILVYEDKEEQKGSAAVTGSGGNSGRTNPVVHPDAGKSGKVPEAIFDSGKAPLVETPGVSLVASVGYSQREIRYYSLDEMGLIGGIPSRFDRIYYDRRKNKRMSDYALRRIKKEVNKCLTL